MSDISGQDRSRLLFVVGRKPVQNDFGNNDSAPQCKIKIKIMFIAAHSGVDDRSQEKGKYNSHDSLQDLYQKQKEKASFRSGCNPDEPFDCRYVDLLFIQ